eukprot:1090354-Prymnesium_polylepis.3
MEGAALEMAHPAYSVLSHDAAALVEAVAGGVTRARAPGAHTSSSLVKSAASVGGVAAASWATAGAPSLLALAAAAAPPLLANASSGDHVDHVGGANATSGGGGRGGSEHVHIPDASMAAPDAAKLLLSSMFDHLILLVLAGLAAAAIVSRCQLEV